MAGAVSRVHGVVLAFDFGLRRIGIATANRLTRSATPLTTLHVGAGVPWEDLDRIVADWRPQQLLVGMPAAGGPASIAGHAAAFAAALEKRYGLGVATVDESLTSHAAQAALREARRAGLARRAGAGRIDRHAACLIAEQWMNELRNGD